MKILIDAGHGGHDSGACGHGIHEADITLKIAMKLRNMLIADGVKVGVTRADNTFIELSHRHALQKGYDLFISIHNNSAGSESASGYEVWSGIGQAASGEFAKVLLSSIIAGVTYYKRKKKLDYEIKNRGCKRKNFAVVNKPLCKAAALVELGFISNAYEAELLKRDDFLWTLANYLKLAIYKYMERIA